MRTMKPLGKTPFKTSSIEMKLKFPEPEIDLSRLTIK
jgi:hypothetical protein